MSANKVAPEQTFQQARKKRGPQIKYIRAPRPHVPWKMVPKQRSASKSSGMFNKFMHKSKTKEIKEGGEEEEEEHHDENKSHGIETRTRKYCTRRVIPGILFVTGLVLTTIFVSNMIETVYRHQSSCYLSGFKPGSTCRDCIFSVNINGVSAKDGAGKDVKLGYMLATWSIHPDTGVVSADSGAFECCADVQNVSEINCCEFATSGLEDAQNLKYCDRVPRTNDCPVGSRGNWPCTYKMGGNNNPYDVEYGELYTEYSILYAGGFFLLVLWPASLMYNALARSKYEKECEERMDSVQAQEEMQREREMADADEMERAKEKTRMHQGAVDP